jgi:ABC-2 type transport system ATP-binding protein
MGHALETQGLSKVYKSFRGRIRALEPIDLQVETGRVFGLLGANGAGKSTFVKTVLGICRPTTGTARILGRDSRQAEARRSVGYLPEGTAFPRYLTGRGVCEYFGMLKGLKGANLKSEVNAKLKLVGMETWGDKRVTKYSKGMKQRVGLAQALLGDPQLVMLDEPTDGVDPTGRHEIRDMIKELGTKDVTIFLNSHLLAEVEAVCDEIAIMYRGKLLRHGPVRQITDEMSIKDGLMQFKFRLGDLPAEMPRGFENSRKDDDGLIVSVKDKEDVPVLIDALRDAGVPVYEVIQYHASLEEAFLQIMDGGGDEGVGGAQS